MFISFLAVQDYRENRRKCTLEPLRGLAGIEIVRLPRTAPREAPYELPGGILLEVGAPALRPEDAALLGGGGRIVLLDATWVRVKALKRRLKVREGDSLEPRSMPLGIQTAYPRRSKLHEDPEEGLASVEALFAASAILGAPREDFFAHYRWSQDFLALNERFFAADSRCSAASWS
jgi:pre-rRNA-processing protein TSR3